MIIHILKDGTEVKDISKVHITREANSNLYDSLEKIIREKVGSKNDYFREEGSNG